MTIAMLQKMLLWCSVINIGLFAIAFLIFRYAHDWVYGYHGRWYKLTVHKFNSTYYTVMAFYKILILFFNIVPYFALKIIG